MGDQFIGKWKMVHSDKYDDFLRTLGVPWLTRKAACSSSPTIEITKNASTGTWQLKVDSAFKTSIIVFKLNEELEETRVDGEKVVTTFTLEGDKLVQRCKGSVDYTIVREVANEVLKATMTAKDVTALRLYKKEAAK
ncbi:myelin P2 protein-like isoform X1 [Dinothrombium tinctorium]|uniref:Myelin P2 protein-like isoform X1 n=1 Tax=Dinothrombium tinctorium TaxID=1965070 RepID=A0A3S3NZM5_9ACAR|nr:myelin P2 protein-like isoform X1 [Dinothrombium tinctorium]